MALVAYSFGATLAIDCLFPESRTPRLQRALELEDRDRPTAIMFRPTMVAGLLRMWIGRLEEAREALYSLRRDCLERGEESDLMFVSFHTVILECRRGDLSTAVWLANDTRRTAAVWTAPGPWPPEPAAGLC